MTLPTNNAQILENPETAKDRFYLLGSLEQTHSGYEIHIPANGPIVAQQKDDAAATGAFPRKAWDNREERANLPGVTSNMRMIGAGGIVSVQVGNETPKTILFEKTAGPSKGRMAQASGLSDQNPLQVMWQEIAEETGILIVDRKAQKLSLVVLEPSGFQSAVFTNEAEQTAFLERQEQTKLSQIDTIREQLPQEMKGWTIDTVRKQMEPNQADMPYLNPVKIIMPDGSEAKANVLVSDSEKTANVNLLMPVVVPFPKGTELMFLDPEEFKRPVKTFTRAQMLTPEFIANNASVPMTPYLKQASAIVLGTSATPQAWDVNSLGPDLTL